MKKTYLITYEAYDINGVILKKGVYRVKNQESEFCAKINFEKFLQRTVANFNRLYISQCKEDIVQNLFGDNPFGKTFGDIFNGS